MPFAEVAVQAPTGPARTFSYSIPPHFALLPGHLVWVPFGSQTLLGVVFALAPEPAVPVTRPVLALLHPTPLLSPEDLRTARWISEEYLCSLYEAAALFLPPRMTLRPNVRFRLTHEATPPGDLSAEERAAWVRASRPQGVSLLEVARLLGARRARTLAERLVRAGLWLREALPPSLAPPKRATIPAPSPRQSQPLPFRLTPDQERAVALVRASLLAAERPPVLLYGVTGSGKTEVYLQALQAALEGGKRGIVLVPEIALTPQTVQRFEARFPGQVALLHSRLTPAQRAALWWRIREGGFSIVVGPRSALFAPQPELGIIILDEEHDPSYKQAEHAPRYHAREVARVRAESWNALLLLGSATPSLESFHAAQSGSYRLVRLPERVAGAGPPSAAGRLPATMPEVHVVDLRLELKEGNRSIFSRLLRDAMAKALTQGDQVILFLNRRGAASSVVCRDCGHVLACRRCDLPLTYHAAEQSLICHLCSRRRTVPPRCPQCGGGRIRYLGLGTQRVEEEVHQLFPGVRTLRWDRDVARYPAAHERILAQFQARAAQVLIGTQMVAKGLDIPSVTLVGILCADIGLHLPDFRAAERGAQLLLQIAGRAGRGPAGGSVVLQTYAPSHPAVLTALTGDYDTFLKRQLAFRQQHAYPPFSRLAVLLYADPNAQRSQREAERLYRNLVRLRAERGLWDLELLGPAPAYIRRLRGRYRWQVLVRGPAPQRLLASVVLPQGWTVDVDPVSLV